MCSALANSPAETLAEASAVVRAVDQPEFNSGSNRGGASVAGTAEAVISGISLNDLLRAASICSRIRFQAGGRGASWSQPWHVSQFGAHARAKSSSENLEGPPPKWPEFQRHFERPMCIHTGLAEFVLGYKRRALRMNGYCSSARRLQCTSHVQPFALLATLLNKPCG